MRCSDVLSKVNGAFYIVASITSWCTYVQFPQWFSHDLYLCKVSASEHMVSLLICTGNLAGIERQRFHGLSLGLSFIAQTYMNVIAKSVDVVARVVTGTVKSVIVVARVVTGIVKPVIVVAWIVNDIVKSVIVVARVVNHITEPVIVVASK